MKNQYIVFYLSDEKWALPIDKIRGIVSLQGKTITEVPTLPKDFKGVFNYRGNILFIITLNYLLDIADISFFSAHDAELLVLNIENKNIGIYCDKIFDIVDVSKEKNTIVNEKRNDFVKSYINNKDLIGIIDIDNAINFLLNKI